MRLSLGIVAALLAVVIGISAQTVSDARKIASVDHRVAVRSIVSAIAGQTAQIYVRERVAEGMKSPAADRVVLFVHGAGTPAEVAFDVPTAVQTTGVYPLPPAQPQQGQRTEAEARRVAERNRAERERQRRAGTPVELIPSYVAALIGPVPASLGVSPFYKKYVDAQGIPVLSSERAPDDALLVARDIIITMLSARPDIRKAMIERRWRTGVIAETEMTADIPEYANNKRPDAPAGEPVTQADRDYHAWRSRGLGGNPTTGAEENLLGYPGTRYYGEHIFLHEFAHAIMSNLLRIEPTTGAAIQAAYDEAKAAGKYIVASTGRPHYAMTNSGEYWAEGVQWWFFSNYGECFTGNVKVDTPDEFKAYDPTLFDLIGRVFDTHRVPMDVFHGKQVRKVTCPAGDTSPR